MQVNYSFVILHYLNAEETKKCVDSLIRNIKCDSYQIIIVDNGSNNGTYEELYSLYNERSNIILLKSNTNLGFACGNNIGFQYAKYKCKSKFIILINSDTIITQENFCSVISEKYIVNKFALLGPDVLTSNLENHSNPMALPLFDVKSVKNLVNNCKRKLVLCKLRIEPIYAIYKRLKNKVLKRKKMDFTKEWCNIKIHGCCLIFSEEYILKFEGLYDKTFLYGEEEILCYLCEKNNLKIMYTPDLKIIHNESASTKKQYKNLLSRHKFYYTNLFNSYQELLKLVYEDEQVMKEH